MKFALLFHTLGMYKVNRVFENTLLDFLCKDVIVLRIIVFSSIQVLY